MADRHTILAHRIRLLVWAIIGYNVIEALIALSAGVRASSTALVGFGLDSVIEVAAAAAVAWQFAAADPERREKAALRFIAVSFFALAAYVTVESVLALAGVDEARPSPLGIALAAVSLAVMPLLAWAQIRAGREIGSTSVVAELGENFLISLLGLLVGLGLNAAFGWSWADSVAALVIAGFAVHEGLEAWRGDPCC